MAREEAKSEMVTFWPKEPKILIGYALEDNHLPDGSENPFVRVELEAWVIKLAFQLKQFIAVDLEKML